jgi:EpsI family protein
MNPLRNAGVICALLVSAAVTAAVLKSPIPGAPSGPKVVIADDIPGQFQQWHEDASTGAVVADPAMTAQLKAVYSDTLSRIYVDGERHHVMLSIAYGSDQSSEATQAHRPEYCYSAQGFVLTERPPAEVDLGATRVAVRRLVGTRGERIEPISYWLTIDGQPTLPGLNRKWLQFQYRLRGRIPDGVIFRVSTVGLSEAESFAVQDAFLKALFESIDGPVRRRYFGA